MKILFALDDFPPVTYTSASTLTYNFAKDLLRRGHEIFVITSVQKPEKQGYEEFDGLKIFRIFSSYNNRFRPWLSIYNPKVVREFNKRIKEIKPDICHFHHIHVHLSYYCLKLARKHSKGVFITAHDVMFFHYGKLMPKSDKYIRRVSLKDQIKEAGKTYNPFRNLFIRYYLRYADKIFAVSNSLKELLIINGIKNVETIYNGINIDEWKNDYAGIENFKERYNIFNKKIIFFGGRISGAKGGGQILESLSIIRNKINDVVLIIAGEENQYTQNMKKIIQKLKINENVIFLGLLSGAELKNAYSVSDVCVSPSLCFETFGMINLEAMASKKPVVSSFFGGPGETVIDGKTGYLVNPRDVELMSEKILELLKNPQKAKQFGENGYQRAKTVFSTKIHAEETLKWYLKFLTND